MYQSRVRDGLSPFTPTVSAPIEATMWDLFLAIGEVWKLTDNTAGYRLRLRAFMANRISLDSRYEDYYEIAARVITNLIAGRKAELIVQGSAEADAQIKARQEAYEDVLLKPPRGSERKTVKKHVSDEFIAWRLALGGFADFGALNYRGYFGGANVPNEPVPYRTREHRP
jgi:hypothetical protein